MSNHRIRLRREMMTSGRMRHFKNSREVWRRHRERKQRKRIWLGLAFLLAIVTIIFFVMSLF